MTTFARILPLLISSVLCIAGAHAGGPRMIDAINALRRAKTSADPSKELSIAAQDLRYASKDKVGYRAEALHIVEGAIASHPDKITLDRLIDEAIVKAEEGASVSHKHHRRG